MHEIAKFKNLIEKHTRVKVVPNLDYAKEMTFWRLTNTQDHIKPQ